MAEVRLARDVSTVTSFATTLLVVTAGSESTTDSYYVDKGVYGPKYISAAITFPTPGAAVQVDLQISQGGVIWHTIRSITQINGERIEFFAPQGFFRFRAVSFTGAPTCSISVVARSVVDRLEINSVGPTPETITAGAAALFGSAAFPITQALASTNFVEMNFSAGNLTGWSAGLMVRTASTGGAAVASFTGIQLEATVEAQQQMWSGIDAYVVIGVAGEVQGGLGCFNAALAFYDGAGAIAGGGAYRVMKLAVNESAATDISGALRVAFLELTMEGAGGVAGMETLADSVLFGLVGFTPAAAATNPIITNGATTEGSATFLANCIGIKIGVAANDGVGYAAYYIPAVPLADWS